MGHCEFQRDTTAQDEGRPARDDCGGCLRPRVPGPRGKHGRSYGRAIQPFAAGERPREFREGSPAYSCENCARFRPESRSPAALRNVRGTEGLVAMSEAAGTLPARQVYVPPEINPWFIALTVTLATFMEVLDTSIANVSLPHIAGGLGAGVDESTWILTSYLVSNAIVLPMSGWFSSLIGRKRFYMSCVAVFTISSFLCGLAPNLATLILFRVLQAPVAEAC